MTYSVAHVVCCGRSQAELDRRAASIGRDLADLRTGGIAGTPAEVIDAIGTYAELGAQRIYLQILDLHDLEHLELIANEVVPQLG